MKILILGSEGQIGLPLQDRRLKMGDEVVAIDIVNDKTLEDLRIKDCLNRLPKDIDFCFFLAFDVGGSQYLNKKDKSFEYIQNNVLIMNNCFEYLKKNNIPFMFASSQMSNMTHTNYGLLKLIGERYTKALGGINVRFWNVFGPETDSEKFHMITDFIIGARDNKEIRIRSTGTEERQLLHVDDAVRALNSICSRYKDLDKNKYYDITSFKWSSVKQVADIIAELFEAQVEVSENQLMDMQKGFKNEPTNAISSFWKPEISLEDGIKKVIEKMK